MSDTAAFFAKKKKKKAFKFNANKIDVAKVASTIQIEVSADDETPAISSLSLNTKPTTNLSAPSTGGDWDETAVAPTQANATGHGAAAELMDMKALELKRSEQDDIAERMRVEETRAKLAAAREGMEKEAQRLKDEKEKEEAKKAASQASRFGAAASSGIGGGGGGKWVPVHMRNSAPVAPRAMPGASRFGAAASNTGFQRKVDTGNEELFPDLATAGKLAQEEEEQKAAIAAVKQAAFAKKAKAESDRRKAAEKALEEERERKEAEELKKKEEEEAAAKKAAEVSAVAADAPVKKKKKKKKKDLSSFKPT
jgi:hypothetical protein